MSALNRKALKSIFADAPGFVDPQDSGEVNERDVNTNADKPTRTWPVCRRRHPSTPSSDEETSATRTPDNDDAHSVTCELETEVHAEQAFFEASTIPPSPAANAELETEVTTDVTTEVRAEEDLFEANAIPPSADNADGGLCLDDTDPVSPCALSMWQTAAASFYLPSPQGTPSGFGLGPSPMMAAEPAPVTAEPSFLPGSTPCGWTAAGAALLHAAREDALASVAGSMGAAPPMTRFQELRSAAGLPFDTAARALGDAPALGNVGALLAASATSSYAAGDALMSAASGGPLPAASWARPQRASRPAQAKKASVAAKVKGGQSWTQGGQGRQGFQREDPNRLECRRHPAKQRPEGEQVGPSEPLEERTTIMLRNVPNDYTRDMLHELIEARGFGGKCDFLYLPMDFHTQSNLGYAFVNLERAEDAWRFWEVFEGFSKWAVRSKKVGSLRWSECQGFEANVKRYRNSPVMGDAVPDCHKPAIYAGGERIDFPAPTKLLRAPRIKQLGLKF